MKDDILKSWFAELRAGDRTQSPALDAILERRPRAANTTHRPVILALATAGVVLLGVEIWNRSQGGSPPSVAEIMAWQPATDAFLPAVPLRPSGGPFPPQSRGSNGAIR